MKTSLVKLKAELKLIQEDHLFLNSFFWGDLHRAYGEGGAANGTDEVQYPIMCCYEAPSGGNMSRLLTGVSLIIVVADKTFKDYSSLDDTTSDTLQCCRDIYNTLKRSPRWRKILTVRTASVSRFIDKGDDMITGHILQLQVDLKDSESYCNLPMPDYDFEGGPEAPDSCPSGTVQNSTLTYSEQVASGGVLELPNITHTDSDGSPVTLPAQTAFVATPCATSTLIYSPPPPSGVWTIYRNFDEGWHVQNGTFNYNPPAGVRVQLKMDSSGYFTKVTPNNAYGNDERFTNDLGGTVTDGSDSSTPNYVVDNFSGLGRDTTQPAVGLWNALIDYCAAHTSAAPGSYSGFRAPAFHEQSIMVHRGLSTAAYNYAPFNLVILNAIGTGSTYVTSTTRSASFPQNGDVAFNTKTGASLNMFPVRNHFF